MSINDRDIFACVDAYVHGLLSPAEAREVEQQCESSRVWQAALDEARQRLELLRSVPTTEASDTLIRETLAKIDRETDRHRRLKRVMFRTLAWAAAASIAVVGGLHLYYASLSPSPYDLRVFGQTELLADSQAALRVQLFDRSRQAGVEGVPVRVELRNPKQNQVARLAAFQTAADGSAPFRFQLPDWKNGDYELHVIAEGRGAHEEITRTVKLKRSWNLMLSTDKPVYQPGQTIRCRTLALRRPDLEPVAGRDAVFSVTDPKGNVIYKPRGVTSKFGIASIDCPLATEIIEGPYTIACTIDDTTSRLTVEVKKYVLPKFKVAVELDEPYYEPGRTVRGTVQCDYFFGQPVAGAEVRIRVSATDVKPTVLRELTAATDATGRAAWEFTLPTSLVGREQDAGDARIAVEAEVTDTAGQTASRSLSRIVTARPLRVELIPEAGTLLRGVSNTVYAFASYADGRPADVRLVVSGLANELQTGELGTTSFEITPTTENVSVTVRALDADGRVAQQHVQLPCGASDRDFLIRTDKAVYDGGDTMHLVALGGGREPIFVDFIKDGQTILTQSFDFVDGRGEYQFDLPPDVFGTLEIVAYRFGPSALPVRQNRVVYVRQASNLQIDARLDRPEYRPGESAKLVLAVTDADGRPAPGAVSLAAVDEAVFSVLDQAPGMEQRFFTLEEELLKPIYAIYPWSPDLTSSVPVEDRARFEQALFSRCAAARKQQAPDRAALLQELVDAGDVTPRMLEVLNNPELDQLLNWLPDSSRLRAVLGEQSQCTLWATSYPAKAQRTSSERTSGLRMMRYTWTVLGITFALVTVVMLCVAYRSTVLLYVGAGVLLFLLLVSVLMPSLSRARELSYRALDASNLSALDKAIQIRDASSPERAAPSPAAGPAAAPPRIREWFPETLLWRPELVTDDQGQVSLDVELADSITTWRLSASAVAADGRLGGTQSAIRVFQPFFVDLNLPVALTRFDEIAIPVVVYNYLDEPQTVDLTLDDAPWFERLSDAAQQTTLAARAVESVSYRIRVLTVGHHQLQITARGRGVADAVKRSIEVVSNGRPVEQVFNGTLQRPADLTLTVPDTAIPGSIEALVKVYPTSFSQLVEGLDTIFQQPYGCFEQTSSTTYPNVLALDYLRRTGKSVPEVEAKARQYIHLGYQRLLGFEVANGGFDWFGRPPANRTLTAYGLMEFMDMARVHDVDPQLIERTRTWLIGQRQADGSWSPEQHRMHVDPTQGGKLATLSTTAYIAWAVFGGETSSADPGRTQQYLLAHPADTIADPYVLALVCNALLALDPAGTTVQPYVARLESLSQAAPDGKTRWWEQAVGARTQFYGGGRAGNVETTALAALALIHADGNPTTIRGALAWLAEQRDALGTFQSTQATVLALKALLAGTGRPLGGDKERRIEIALDNSAKLDVNVPAEQAEVMEQVDLSDRLAAGAHRLVLTDRSDTGAGYQVMLRYYVPQPPTAAAAPTSEPLAIRIDYDRTNLQVSDTVTATATVINQRPTPAPMVILDLPIPAGFSLAAADLERLVTAGTIAKFQLNARSAVIYLLELKPGVPLELQYHLQATMPVRLTVPPARAYEYYNPDTKGTSQPTQLEVTQRT